MSISIGVDIRDVPDKATGREMAIRRAITLVPELFKEFTVMHGPVMDDISVDIFVKKHNIRILKEDPYVVDKDEKWYINVYYIVGYDI